jgi:hypothetical protein
LTVIHSLNGDWLINLLFNIESRLVNIARIDRLNIEKPDSGSLIVFVSPVHGFNYPPIMLHFIMRFPKGQNKVILMNTRAGMLIGKAYEQVQDKKSTMIYAENYGEAGAVMVLGKKYNLPEPVCFSESFYYWIPRKAEHEVTNLIYINDAPGEDVNNLFGDCREIGRIENPLAREYGVGVWLYTNPRSSFNKFWDERVHRVTNSFHH